MKWWEWIAWPVVILPVMWVGIESPWGEVVRTVLCLALFWRLGKLPGNRPAPVDLSEWPEKRAAVRGSGP